MTNSTSNRSTRAANLQGMVLTGLFVAILLVMGFTPLGLIDLPIIKATILHVPVIIGSVLLGPWRGGFLGFMFGLISLWKNTMAPSLLSFAFSPLVPVPGEAGGSPWALVICFIPRILVGVVPWFVVRLFELIPGNKGFWKGIGMFFAGGVGSIVNTALVMGMMGLTLGNAFAAAKDISPDMVGGAIMAIVFANGVPEAIAAIILTPVICLGVSKALKYTRVLDKSDKTEKLK